jgi:hypothetical protein
MYCDVRHAALRDGGAEGRSQIGETMPEGNANIEIAQHLREHGEHESHAEPSRRRIESNETKLTANETLLYDTSTFTAWLQAHTAGEAQLAGILSARFTPEYKVAFDAWLKLDPLNTPGAPPGPRYMPEYKDPLAEKAKGLGNEATAAFEEVLIYCSVLLIRYPHA